MQIGGRYESDGGRYFGIWTSGHLLDGVNRPVRVNFVVAVVVAIQVQQKILHILKNSEAVCRVSGYQLRDG